MEKFVGKNTVRKCMVIIGGILVYLCFGIFYVFGNISSYMISYLRNRTSENSLRNVDNLWINNGAQIVTPFAVTAGGLIERRLGVRIATLVGCVLFSSGIGLTYFTIKKSLVLVALSYGTLTSVGSYIAYGPPAQTVVKWLPRRPTFAVGLIMCGMGAGALILNLAVTSYINPKNLSPDLKTPDGEMYFTDKDVLDRVPTVFLLLAGSFICLQFIGVLLLSSPPGGNKLENDEEDDDDGEDDKDEEEERQLSSIQKKREPSKEKAPLKTMLLTMLTDKNAYIWLFIFFLLYGGMTFVNSLYKTYGQTFIADDHFIAVIGSLSAVFNSAFRPIWGLIMDKYGFQVTVKLASAGFVCLSGTIILTESLGKMAFLLWICGLYATSCCILSLGPITLAKLYGVDYMAISMGFTYIGMTAAAITAGFVGLNLQSVLGWHGIFLLAASMGTAAFFVTFFFDGKDTKGKLI